ncbi:hypothetical protein GA0070608_0119 [Micromonospora peucetia]|uniref:Uncharacterized protein n=1 Tax=Micromonospora peucetia TaxID=47871 RepID=A0A1C6TYT9_9ACTN|nr:hypothetical protein GA0070608_0119 [Micromonospora peucetia]
MAAGTLVALTLTGCSLDYDDRRDYLRTVAFRGAETHSLIASSEGKPDAERCKAAHIALNDDAPGVGGTSIDQEEWIAQVEAFFVDSCVSGKPKELPPLGPPATPAVTVSPSVPPSGTPAATPSAAVTP